MSTANEEHDLRINSWAADAQLQWKGHPESVRHTRPTRDDLEAFETVYNAACLSIAKGEFDQAGILLKRAKGENNSKSGTGFQQLIWSL